LDTSIISNLNNFLGNISPADIRSRYNAKELNDNGIYPGVGTVKMFSLHGVLQLPSYVRIELSAEINVETMTGIMRAGIFLYFLRVFFQVSTCWLPGIFGSPFHKLPGRFKTGVR
jgi:hypothetical protein